MGNFKRLKHFSELSILTFFLICFANNKLEANYCDQLLSKKNFLLPARREGEPDLPPSIKQEINNMALSTTSFKHKTQGLVGKLFYQQSLKKLDKRYLKRIQEILNEGGVTTILKKEFLGNWYLEFDFSKHPTNQTALFYKRLKEKYRTKHVTLSLRGNIQSGTKGYSQGHLVDIGYEQIEELLSEIPSNVAIHEMRHQYFKWLKLNQKKSAYLTTFKSLNSHPLHSGYLYTKYMSAEELYNFSKDIGRKFINLKNDFKINNKISQHNLMELIENLSTLIMISQAVEDLTTSNLIQLNLLISNLKQTNRLSRSLMKKHKVSIFLDSLKIIDSMRRETTIHMGAEDELIKLSQTRNFLFSKKHPHFLLNEVASWSGLTSALLPINRANLINLLEIAKMKIETLNQVASKQKEFAKTVNLNVYSNMDQFTKEQNLQFLNLGVEIGKGVVEDYKWFIGNQ